MSEPIDYYIEGGNSIEIFEDHIDISSSRSNDTQYGGYTMFQHFIWYTDEAVEYKAIIDFSEKGINYIKFKRK